MHLFNIMTNKIYFPGKELCGDEKEDARAVSEFRMYQTGKTNLEKMYKC